MFSLLVLVVFFISTSNCQIVEFISTFNNFSYYKVKIEYARWNNYPNLLLTDDVVSQTCTLANGLSYPAAPCASNNVLCPYYNTAQCRPAGETGCQQPFQDLALSLGCTHSYDAKCIYFSATPPIPPDVYALAGSKFGGLFVHMGGGVNGYACGNSFLRTDGCGDGRYYKVDGTQWENPCYSGSKSFSTAACTSKGCGTTNQVCTGAAGTLEHWALCIGRTKCLCKSGTCDITSSFGYCKFGSCKSGWWGVYCDKRCDADFCLGRADPMGTNKGVYTTGNNECYCVCGGGWEPSGVGNYGDLCKNCGTGDQCTSATGGSGTTSTSSLVAVTPVTFTLKKNEEFNIKVQAQMSNGAVMTSAAATIYVTQLLGGGGGDGGALQQVSRVTKLTNGEILLTFSYTDTCDACYFQIRSLPDLGVVPAGPITVLTQATKIVITNQPLTIARNTFFPLTVEAVDNIGTRAKGETSSIAVTLEPKGGNGDGGILSSSTALVATLVSGAVTLQLKFSESCTACVLTVTSSSTYGVVKSAAILVTTTGTKLVVSPTQSIPRAFMRNFVFGVVVSILDASGNKDATRTTACTASLLAGSPTVSELKNNGGNSPMTLTYKLGISTYYLSFTRACALCSVTFRDTDGAVAPVSLGPYQIMTSAVKLSIASTVPASLNIGEYATFTIQAVDELGDLDTLQNKLIQARLLPNGGNGDGGNIVTKPVGILNQSLVNGTYTYYLSFSKACTACILEFTDVSGVLTKIVTTPIFVSSARVRLSTKNPTPSSLAVGATFEVTVQSLDINGNIDVKDTSRVTLKLLPNGGNGDGGVLSDIRGLQRSLVAGEVTFTPTFSKACTLCILQIVHEVTTIPALSLNGIEVRTTATRLVFSEPPPSTVSRRTSFRVTVQAVDDNGNIDTGDQGVMTIKLKPNGGNGDGGDLRADGSNLVNKLLQKGVGTWNLDFTKACDACVIQVVDSNNKLPTLSSLGTVVTTAGQLISSTSDILTTPIVTKRNFPYTIPITILDDAGSVDSKSTAVVSVTLLANGGNGGGTPLANQPAGLSMAVVAGKVTFTLTHGSACDTCVLVFSSPGLQGLTLSSIRVNTLAKSITLKKTLPTKVKKGEAFDLSFAAVDETGSIDRTWIKQVSFSKAPGGGNGDGGELMNTVGDMSLQQPFVNGEVAVRVAFSKACTACTINIMDLTGLLPILTTPAVTVTAPTTQLRSRITSGDRTYNGVPFMVEVRAVDVDGNTNIDDVSEVSVQMVDTSLPNQPSVATTSSDGGTALRQVLVQGVATFNLVVSGTCTTCALRTSYSATSGSTTSTVGASVLTMPNHVSTSAPVITPAPLVVVPVGTSPVIAVIPAPPPTPAPPGSTATPAPPQTILIMPTFVPTPAPATPVPPTSTRITTQPPTTSSSQTTTNTSSLDNTTLMWIGIAVGAFIFLLLIGCLVVWCIISGRSGAPKLEQPPIIISQPPPEPKPVVHMLTPQRPPPMGPQPRPRGPPSLNNPIQSTFPTSNAVFL